MLYAVYEVAPAHGGRLVVGNSVTGDRDGPGKPVDMNFRVWDAKTGKLLQEIDCSSFGEDSEYFISPGTVIPAGGLQLPYGPTGPTTVAAGTVVGPNGITLVGLRPYSSPNCNPMTGASCPVDGTPVFSGIFSENTVARSNYNSLQASVRRRFSRGLPFGAAYTFAKNLGTASSDTDASPSESRTTIARRVGSAKAEKTASSGSAVGESLTIRFRIIGPLRPCKARSTP